jgi:hypothetical protein
MRTIILMFVLTSARVAFAWPGGAAWYWPAQGDDSVMYGGTPGGGGILGTGGKHDYGIKCSDCHVDRPTETIALSFAWQPALVNNTYVPGTTYTVTANLAGANLPCMSGPNGGGDPNMDKKRNFAASFETDIGDAAGRLISDAGQTRGNCDLPPPAGTMPAGQTLLDGDCNVIFSQGATPSWRFQWVAPTTGSVHIYWGAVDGNCDMMSMGDAVANGSTTLAPAPAAPRETTVIEVLVAIWQAV